MIAVFIIGLVALLIQQMAIVWLLDERKTYRDQLAAFTRASEREITFSNYAE